MNALRIADALSRDTQHLVQALGLSATEARIEVQMLMGAALQVQRAYLLAHADEITPPQQAACYQGFIERRLEGEPIAYILGEKEFFSLVFKVSSAVLIPRPETELLVELALTYIPKDTPCQVLDLGTGSGAIAISIAKQRPRATIVAVDKLPVALAVARENALKLEVTNVQFLQCDWYEGVACQEFDMIVSNPPYICAGDPHLGRGDLRFEPINALIAGESGLDAMRTIISGAHAHLRKHGRLLLEHGYNQGTLCENLLYQAGFKKVLRYPDLAGISRLISGAELLGKFVE